MCQVITALMLRDQYIFLLLTQMIKFDIRYPDLDLPGNEYQTSLGIEIN